MNLFNFLTPNETPILSNDQIRELLELARKVRPWAHWYRKGDEFKELYDLILYKFKLKRKDDRSLTLYSSLVEDYRNCLTNKTGELIKLRDYYNKGKDIRRKQHSEILRLRAQVRRLLQIE